MHHKPAIIYSMPWQCVSLAVSSLYEASLMCNSSLSQSLIAWLPMPVFKSVSRTLSYCGNQLFDTSRWDDISYTFMIIARLTSNLAGREWRYNWYLNWYQWAYHLCTSDLWQSTHAVLSSFILLVDLTCLCAAVQSRNIRTRRQGRTRWYCRHQSNGLGTREASTEAACSSSALHLTFRFR